MLTFDEALGKADSAEVRDRSAFLYMEPKPDTPDHAQCATCEKFLRANGKCHHLQANDDVDGDDTCGMYAQGEPNDDPEATPTGQYTKETLGFFDGRVQCQRCNVYDDRDKLNIHCDLYVQLNRMFPRLWKLDEKVKPRGCCNAWGGGNRDPERFGPYGPLPDADDAQSGGLLAQMLEP
jgi:hypothetical protein